MTESHPPVPLVPREVLFGNPDRMSPRISPDAARLAWIAPVDGVLNVWVSPIAGGVGVPVTDDRDRGIRSFFWAHDNQHILYEQDTGGDENWRLYATDLTTGETKDCTPFEGVQARVEHIDKHFPHDVLVGINKDNPQLHDVYRLHLPTGELTKIVENPGFVGFLADSQFRVRGGLAPTDDGGMVVMVRDDEESEWHPVLEIDQEDSLTTSPIEFTLDGKALWAVSSKGFNTGQLVLINCENGVQRLVVGDPEYDISGVHLNDDTKQPEFVTYTKDRVEYQVLDPDVVVDLAFLQSIGDGDMALVGADDADNVWLAAYTNDNGPVSYYAYDRRTQNSRFLFDHRPDLKKYELAMNEPFEFTARDGLQIHGYLHFPLGLPREKLPTVLMVHGGPWARDTWGLDPQAQWLANRGYLVVQVNFRGSTGYGKKFVSAGDREWGAKMHDDLLDAVNVVVNDGFADKDRIAIYGGSYGGYAALVGAAFTPDVFACAVDIVGPSNLKTLIESIPPYWAPMISQFHTRVGNPETEPEFMWERSPLSKADDIRIPLLIAQGANDPRVKQAEAEQIVAALTKHGIDHEYMLFPDEGHGFAKPENRLKFFAAAERFLAKHLGGRYEPEAEPEPQAEAKAEAEPAAGAAAPAIPAEA
jgi:dipeptidyl aminopeptidase/acylaminoacyl peptidase